MQMFSHSTPAEGQLISPHARTHLLILHQEAAHIVILQQLRDRGPAARLPVKQPRHQALHI